MDYFKKLDPVGKILLSVVGTSVLYLIFGHRAIRDIPPGVITLDQKEAAELGDPIARFALGKTYFEFQHYSDACHWLELAEAQGAPEAITLMNAMGAIGKTCRPLSGSARADAEATQVDMSAAVAYELKMARQWQGDAALSYLDVEPNRTSVLIVSPGTHQYVSGNFGTPLAQPEDIQSDIIATPIPETFIPFAKAVSIARADGMRGEVDEATLKAYLQEDGFNTRSMWLIVSGDSHWLIGADNGNLYDYASTVGSRKASPTTQWQPALTTGNCTTARRMNDFDPCSRKSAAPNITNDH